MNKIRKARQEIMKKAYEILTSREEIGECIITICEELLENSDNKLDYDTKTLNEDQRMKLSYLLMKIAEGQFIDDENIIIEFNEFIKNIEMRVE